MAGLYAMRQYTNTFSVPIFTSNLFNLSHVLSKAEQWANENNVEHSKLIHAKLAPDMFDLASQIYTCTNASKFLLSRILGQEVPVWEDNETTFEQLRERINKTQELLKTIDATALDGKADSPVAFKAAGRELNFTGLTYLQYFSLPNFFFHVVTAYDILRNAGVPLGKTDYIAGGRQSVP